MVAWHNYCNAGYCELFLFTQFASCLRCADPLYSKWFAIRLICKLLWTSCQGFDPRHSDLLTHACAPSVKKCRSSNATYLPNRATL